MFLGWTGNGSLARRPSSGDLGETRETGGAPSERQSSAWAAEQAADPHPGSSRRQAQEGWLMGRGM